MTKVGVTFSITTKCNLSCTYCYGHAYPEYYTKEHFLDINRISATLDIIQEQVASGILARRITIHGGEPTVLSDADFATLFDSLIGVFDSVALSTNLHVLSPSKKATLANVKAKLDLTILTSYDFESSQRGDRLHTWANNVRWLNSIGVTPVGIISITSKTFDCAEELSRNLDALAGLDFRMRLGVVSNAFKHTKEEVVDSNYYPFALKYLDPTELEKKTAEVLVPLFTRMVRQGIKVHVLSDWIRRNRDNVPLQNGDCNRNFCTILLRNICVTNSGDTFTCSTSRRKSTDCGNIYNTDFTRILDKFYKHNQRANAELLYTSKSASCPTCAVRSVCNFGCESVRDSVKGYSLVHCAVYKGLESFLLWGEQYVGSREY